MMVLLQDVVPADQGSELCGLRGVDDRHLLPRSIYRRRPALMIFKLAVSSLVLVAAILLSALVWSALYPLSVLVVGLTFAYWVELQHECLHLHAFQSRAWNRVVGGLTGLPMSSSYTEYRLDHLFHHSRLGKSDNREFFSYRFRGLDSLAGLARAAFSLHRYRDVAAKVAGSFFRRRPAFLEARRPGDRAAIRSEYALVGLLFAAAAVEVAALRSCWLLLYWLVPALLVAEAAHFMIELPEHYALNTQDNDDVYSNTRTILGSTVSYVLTNGNNLHTAHHFHHGVPMCNIRELNELIAGRVAPMAREPTYLEFYRKVITGRLRHRAAQSCMVE